MNVSKSVAIRFLQGQETAIAEVYSKYRKLLYFIISTYVDTKEDCEDAYQDVFAAILQKKGEIKDPLKLHWYLCQTAKNMAINRAKIGKRTVDQLDEEAFGETQHTRLSELLPYDLSDEERAIIGYRLCLGLSYQEISEITGVVVPTLKARYSRAIKKTKEALK